MKWLCVVLFVFSGTLHSQTLGPTFSECGKRCSGSFQVTNNGLTPMTVTVEPHGFKMEQGTADKATFTPADNNADVQLSTTSARLSPKQTYTFDYKIRCHELPCQVGLAAGMMIGHTDEGLAVKLVMGHIVYSCEKARDCRRNTLHAVGVEVAKK